jgi:hypothetical protein
MKKRDKFQKVLSDLDRAGLKSEVLRLRRQVDELLQRVATLEHGRRFPTEPRRWRDEDDEITHKRCGGPCRHCTPGVLIV